MYLAYGFYILYLGCRTGLDMGNISSIDGCRSRAPLPIIYANMLHITIALACMLLENYKHVIAKGNSPTDVSNFQQKCRVKGDSKQLNTDLAHFCILWVMRLTSQCSATDLNLSEK